MKDMNVIQVCDICLVLHMHWGGRYVYGGSDRSLINLSNLVAQPRISVFGGMSPIDLATRLQIF